MCDKLKRKNEKRKEKKRKEKKTNSCECRAVCDTETWKSRLETWWANLKQSYAFYDGDFHGLNQRRINYAQFVNKSPHGLLIDTKFFQKL